MSDGDAFQAENDFLGHMEIHGFQEMKPGSSNQWKSFDFHRFSLIFIDFHRFSSIFIDFHRFS